MNFRTQVELPEGKTEIRHSDRLMLFGSCFAENIGNLLLENKFRCDMNPFGILYNPLSIAEALGEVIEGKRYTETDLFEAGGMWHSWMHHSSFSARTKEDCLANINARLEKASSSLPETDWLIVTFGTAYVYTLKDDGRVVGNCHKQPDRHFTRRLLTTEEIFEKWADVFEKRLGVFPKTNVLFTVSPIRHAKDGMHGNQLSKATLLLAIERLCKEYDFCHYFPSYEIMLDELRDYRFYADDMLHPSPLAVEYIWECFGKCFFSRETKDVMRQWEEVRRGLEHKPFHPDSEAYRKFLSQIVLKMHHLKEKIPYLEAQKELEQCQALLKT